MIRRPEIDTYSAWARLGVGFNAPMARRTPDVERLLATTARLAPRDARLFEMVATWLAVHAQLVAVRRLGVIAESGMTDDDSATLGLMLELAAASGAARSFSPGIRCCRRAPSPGPLYETDRQSKASIELVRRHALPNSLRWGRWIDVCDIRPDLIRPLRWIVDRNSSVISERLSLDDADLSVLLALRDAGPAEVVHAAELGRRAGVSRMQASRSLDHLAAIGLADVTRRPEPPSRRASLFAKAS
jgi:hypothetical protein